MILDSNGNPCPETYYIFNGERGFQPVSATPLPMSFNSGGIDFGLCMWEGQWVFVESESGFVFVRADNQLTAFKELNRLLSPKNINEARALIDEITSKIGCSPRNMPIAPSESALLGPSIFDDEAT